tara:strand:+ start:5328 stop:6059 length:732 start_codon:yes stop_codon:yes gene_type:complete
MRCLDKYKHNVRWTLTNEFLKKIKKSIRESKTEIAGKILFKDVNCDSKNKCNKILKDYEISQGNGDSVYTPNGIINFHTHPKKCYVDQGTKYGWPSGEDMGQVIRFAKYNNLVHIVFTLEGAYIIKVNKILNKKNIDILEKVLVLTHVFRSKNQSKQYKDFKDYLKPIIKTNKNNTLKLWLHLINNLTLVKLYKLYNKLYNKKLKIPRDNKNIFNISLNKINNNLIFKARYISEKCHFKFYHR